MEKIKIQPITAAAFAPFGDLLDVSGEADKIINALQVYVLAYAEYLRAVNDFNNHVSKLRSVSGVFQYYTS